MQHVDSGLEAAIERVITLARICSVAARAAPAAKQRARAEMFVQELRGVGFSAGVRDTPGSPIVVGHDRRSRAPSVLFCGHYDEWTAGPLHEKRQGEATRVASVPVANPCNAGQSIQLMAFVEACRAWKAVTGQLPISVSVLVVGERRSGSARLPSILRMYADELNADIGLAPAAWTSCCTAPAVNTMLRGLCREGFTIVAADHDRFRRRHRGNTADPTRVLARILGDLQDASGSIAIPGFYDRVEPLLQPPHGARTDAQGDTIDVPCPPELVPPGSEHGTARIRLRRLWPTYDIDSVSSSRDDAALRSSALSRASAKLSFHLVCDQNPYVIRQAFRRFAQARAASGCRIEFTEEASIPPVRFTMSHPVFGKALDALTNEWGHPAAVACGDAAPAVHALWEALGMQIVVASFSCNFELCRGEREMPEPAKYRLGIRSWARILDALSR